MMKKTKVNATKNIKKKYDFSEDKMAIKKSIAHWKRLLKLVEKEQYSKLWDEGYGWGQCALCEQYYMESCSGCPLGVIGHGCREMSSLYHEAVEMFEDFEGSLEVSAKDKLIGIRRTKKMLTTLEGLLKYC